MTKTPGVPSNASNGRLAPLRSHSSRETVRIDEAVDNKVEGSNELALTSMLPKSSSDIDSKFPGNVPAKAGPQAVWAARTAIAIGNARVIAMVADWRDRMGFNYVISIWQWKFYPIITGQVRLEASIPLWRVTLTKQVGTA